MTKVETMRIVDDTPAVGSLRSRQGVVIKPEIGGRITQLNFRDGDRVRKGQLLVQFDDQLPAAQIKQAEAELAGLTDRERRMLALIAEGYTNRAIGEVLHLSEKTVRNHVSQLLRKLGFQRRSQAAAWAGERRLELPPE